MELVQLGELRIQIGKSAAELFAVTTFRGRFELAFDLRARELQNVSLATDFHFVARQLFLGFAFVFRLVFLDLPFHRLTLPPSSHETIV